MRPTLLQQDQTASSHLDQPTGQCQTAISYHSRLPRWSRPPGWPRRPQRGVWSYDHMPQYRVNDPPSRSRSPTQWTKHWCYVINVFAIETRFRCLLSPQLQPPTLHMYACLCASAAPSPSTALVRGLLETAALRKQWVTHDHVSCPVRLPSSPTLITRRGNRQMNVSGAFLCFYVCISFYCAPLSCSNLILLVFYSELLS